MRTPRIIMLALLAMLASCSNPMKQTPAIATPLVSTDPAATAPVSKNLAPQPPVAAKRPHQVPSPNGSRDDEYYWLRDDKRENPEMLAYVNAENAYADQVMAHTKALETRV